MARTEPKRIVCFGELLLRLAAPGRELLLQSPHLDVVYGGAEANVAVSLARFGHCARMVSVVPDTALGAAAVGELRRWGVDAGGVRTGPGRMGLYFLQPGAAHRAANIVYDREHSAFALAAADLIDWDAELAGADWLHVSGITAALGAISAAAAVRAVTAARAAGAGVSVDCNYRAKLWQAWDGDAPAILSAMLAEADLMFGDERDAALILKRSFESRRTAADALFAAFPNLKRIACTGREARSSDHHVLTAALATRDGDFTAGPHDVTPIVDRIGGGDAFAAGVLHGVLTGMDDARTVAWGLAAACLKHGIAGDANLAVVADVEAMLAGDGLDVKR